MGGWTPYVDLFLVALAETLGVVVAAALVVAPLALAAWAFGAFRERSR
jgi:hypothetical protein